MQAIGAIKDAWRIRLFRFSLKGAEKWLKAQKNFTTWMDFTKRFLDTYFLEKKILENRQKINNFFLKRGEKWGAAWGRYEAMLEIIPEWEMTPREQIESFLSEQPEYIRMHLTSSSRKNYLRAPRITFGR